MYAAALLLQASVAAPVFAPPLDVAIRVITERSDSGMAHRRFKLERGLRFRREATGYRAEIRLLAAPETAPDALVEMMESGFRALVNASIIVHLDSAGQVIAIDHLQSIWERFCVGVGRVAAERKSLSRDERDALARRIAAPLLALPPDRQRDLIGSLVTATIADPAPTLSQPEPVRVPAQSAYGTPLMLDGIRHAAVLPSGEREVTVAAAADLPEAGRLEMQSLKRSDPRTGLIVLDQETTRTHTASGEVLKVTTLRVSLDQAAPSK